jgi:predicted RecB family nuclease
LSDWINPVTSPGAHPLDLSNADVQVVRNIVNALGEIGPDARDAIPTLKTAQHLRVKYIAEEAIAKIEGHPMPTWH